ncbi:MAG: NAD-dependent epimerase/dehydratase family protein [Candidatus Limnocylindrales bacterium]
MRILVTGAAGFINGYLVPELLEAGHEVVGLDDFSKYGRLVKSYDDHPGYRFVEGDAKDAALMRELASDVRPDRRLGGDDRRDQLLPRIRLRPAGRERADPGLHLRRGDRRPS